MSTAYFYIFVNCFINTEYKLTSGMNKINEWWKHNCKWDMEIFHMVELLTYKASIKIIDKCKQEVYMIYLSIKYIPLYQFLVFIVNNGKGDENIHQPQTPGYNDIKLSFKLLYYMLSKY